MDEMRLERALREGPQFRTQYVARALPADGVVLRTAGHAGRLVLVLAVTALLLMLTFTALAIGGFFEREISGYAIVLERAEITVGSRVSHESFGLSGQVALPALANLPTQAVGLRSSPDGRSLAYVVRSEPDDRHSAPPTALVLARGDGSDSIRVDVPRPLRNYYTPIVWAPSSSRFAIGWVCDEGPCESPAGIDVFDTHGGLVAAIPTESLDTPGPLAWSPDSERIGWPRSYCIEEGGAGYCLNDAFRHRSISGPGVVVTVELDPWTEMAWSTTNRLLVTEWNPRFESIGAAYSLALDGSDRQDVPLIPGAAYRVEWSPDGSRIASINPNGRVLTIIDVATGEETIAQLRGTRTNNLESWSPDSKRLVFIGLEAIENSSGNPYYLINADGTGLQWLGIGHDFAWLASP